MKTSPLLGILLAVGLVASVSAQTDPGPVDLTNRESARTWFNANWAKTVNVPMGFTGNVAAGNAGDVSFAYKQATILRVNIMRRMAGMNPVNLSLDGSVKAQLAAMVDSANTDRILAGASMHSPQPDWQFYSAAAANGAAESLMTLGTVGPSTVIGFMFDPGDANASVGHRTELLMPDLLNMEIGRAHVLTPVTSRSRMPSSA